MREQRKQSLNEGKATNCRTIAGKNTLVISGTGADNTFRAVAGRGSPPRPVILLDGQPHEIWDDIDSIILEGGGGDDRLIVERSWDASWEARDSTPPTIEADFVYAFDNESSRQPNSAGTASGTRRRNTRVQPKADEVARITGGTCGFEQVGARGDLDLGLLIGEIDAAAWYNLLFVDGGDGRDFGYGFRGSLLGDRFEITALHRTIESPGGGTTTQDRQLATGYIPFVPNLLGSTKVGRSHYETPGGAQTNYIVGAGLSTPSAGPLNSRAGAYWHMPTNPLNILDGFGEVSLQVTLKQRVPKGWVRGAAEWHQYFGDSGAAHATDQAFPLPSIPGAANNIVPLADSHTPTDALQTVTVEVDMPFAFGLPVGVGLQARYGNFGDNVAPPTSVPLPSEGSQFAGAVRVYLPAGRSLSFDLLLGGHTAPDGFTPHGAANVVYRF